MAEQSFKSPGFFEREIELISETEDVIGTPAGIIGASEYGPAFVPVTVGTFKDFQSRFGNLNAEYYAPYAVNEWLKNRNAVTFLRVLGAGANSTAAHVTKTRDYGVVNNAGFIIKGTDADVVGRRPGAVQFLAATHTISAAADIGFPSAFTDNDSFPTLREAGSAAGDDVELIRAMLFTTTGSLFYVFNSAGTLPTDSDGWTRDCAVPSSTDGTFKLILSCSEGSSFSTGEGGTTGHKVYTASLDPANTNYIGKILNTDPKNFSNEKHLLYLDFPIENDIASVKTGGGFSVALVSGSTGASAIDSGFEAADDRKFTDLFGRFDTRYSNAKTTKFISQPFGSTEYNLFHFETISDGANSNTRFKVSISNIRASNDPNYKYGTFDVLLRKYEDNDFDPQVMEQYRACSLDPNNERFIGRVIGDKKVVYDHDTADVDERRLVVTGRYPNRSLLIRVVIDDAVYADEVPSEALPFGFRGIRALKTSPVLTASLSGSSDAIFVNPRLTTIHESDISGTSLTGSIIPPLPFLFKATRGAVESSQIGFIGHPGVKERSDNRLYWGVKTSKLKAGNIYNANIGTQHNPIVDAYTKFQGIDKLDVLYSAADADKFHNNKFTLARVALIQALSNGEIMLTGAEGLTGSSDLHMREAAYIRNGVVNSKNYTVNDAIANKDRITLATLLNSSSVYYNKFASYAKFTNVFHGGFDGTYILDRDVANYNDKGSSTETDAGGKAGDSITGGLGTYGTDDGSVLGSGEQNNLVASYREAINIMTDPLSVRSNILAIPGIRDPYVTDYAAKENRDYGLAMYVMDIPSYDESTNRLFIDAAAAPNVEKTADQLESRTIDNNYSAAYFPDVYITDPINGRRVLAPPSIAAIGAISYNDSVAYPWFAPAGFNRAALGFVENVKVRLSTADRDKLYESRINPIATFPNGGFVIFGQKTLQLAQSALDRVNVRRMLLEVKRQVIGVAQGLVFEQNTPATRERFINSVSPRLAVIQSQAGIESFRVVMDGTNNTAQDAEENRLNGTIIVVPTRAVEFVAVDFVITNSGVSFE